VLEHGHGAVTRVAADATAFPIRGHSFDFVVISLWEDAKDDARNVAWTRDFFQEMQPWSAAQVYVNALADDDGGRVVEAYSGNYARLADVKAKYDPGNRFRRNQNIRPSRVDTEIAIATPLERVAGSTGHSEHRGEAEARPG
jgi:hypothetical protein